MTVEVNQENALILSLNKQALPNEKEKFFFANAIDCFYNTIDSLAKESKSIKPARPELNVASIRTVFEERYTPYARCAVHLNGAAEMIEGEMGKGPREMPMRTVDDAKTIYNLKNLAGQKMPDLEMASNKYVDSFLSAYKLKHPNDHSCKGVPEWLRIAAEHYRSSELIELVRKESIDEIMERSFKGDEDFLHYQESVKSQQISEQQMTHKCWSLLQKKTAANYGFVEGTAWNPSQSVDSLIDILRSQGPLIVGGLFSEGFHSEPAAPKQIGDKTVYGWKKDSFSGLNQVAHIVTLVGASKKGYKNIGQDLVYFVDPSRPASEGTKVFILSYQSFCQRLGNTRGELVLGKGIDYSKSAFYYCHSALSPKLELKPTAASRQSRSTASASLVRSGSPAHFRPVPPVVTKKEETEAVMVSQPTSGAAAGKQPAGGEGQDAEAPEGRDSWCKNWRATQ